MADTAGTVTVLLAGDVMTGRGVDQILPHPGDPRLWERYVSDARVYVSLAEARHGAIPRPVPFAWPWGDALRAVRERRPAARVINLETSITTSDNVASDKSVHYRMNPANVECLRSFQPDVCVLANNHALDFGRAGVRETLATLTAAELRVAGAGTDQRAANAPAVIPRADGARVIVVAVGSASSGIPTSWAATMDLAGVALLPQLSDATAVELSDRACRGKQPGDVVIVSIHWGSNWGYHVPDEQVDFAHLLIDRGVDLVHGHSSHHPRPIELYRGKLILYGCGDLINDYEGISGYEEYRSDLRLLYLASLDPASGRLASLSLTPMRSRRMRLELAPPSDRRWLRQAIEDASRPFATRIDERTEGSLLVQATHD